jgi:hypothetical protein
MTSRIAEESALGTGKVYKRLKLKLQQINLVPYIKLVKGKG